jgi:peptidoglycan/xylan/chitin deacetylase (PgdA/CDA1 family)
MTTCSWKPGSKRWRALCLALDACSGKFDDDLIEFLIHNHIPATLFATNKWLLANPLGVSVIKAHLDLLDVEDHAERHILAVIGAGKQVSGIPGEPDVLHLCRGATTEYDAQAATEIEKMGYGIAERLRLCPTGPGRSQRVALSTANP